MPLESRLKAHLAQIIEPNQAVKAIAAKREEDLAKPRGALGRLEGLAIQMAAIQNTTKPRSDHKHIIVCAADHGVVEEGVSPYPADVTRQQIENFQREGGAITSLAKAVNAKVTLLDVGVNYDFAPNPARVDRKIAHGTKNMAKGPAMTREEAVRSILAGLELVLDQNMVEVVTAGEMGIGNTTASSAIACVYASMTPEEATGPGSGLSSDKLVHKAQVIRKAIELNKPDPEDPIDVLAKVGGFELGAMAGVYLGGAIRRAAVILDGFVGAAAALLAVKLCPPLKDYLIAGHRSKEKAHLAVLERMGLVPLLDLGMWLGEGSGAAVAMGIIDCAVIHYIKMRTLNQANICDTL